jgi:hypothetical protein
MRLKGIDTPSNDFVEGRKPRLANPPPTILVNSPQVPPQIILSRYVGVPPQIILSRYVGVH